MLTFYINCHFLRKKMNFFVFFYLAFYIRKKQERRYSYERVSETNYWNCRFWHVVINCKYNDDVDFSSHIILTKRQQYSPVCNQRIFVILVVISAKKETAQYYGSLFFLIYRNASFNKTMIRNLK